MIDNYVWYASYGSNISKDRFMCYIKGGKPAGANRNYDGCTDKSAPIDQKPIQIPHELYFAHKAKVWNGGGVCFIHPQRSRRERTLGHMYLIKKEQFAEVVQQENGANESISINFHKTHQQKSNVIDKNSMYGNLLCLGKESKLPIFTFTNEDFLQHKINTPDKVYLATIIKGLKESHQLDHEQLKEYFSSKKGIDSKYLEKVLRGQ